MKTKEPRRAPFLSKWITENPKLTFALILILLVISIFFLAEKKIDLLTNFLKSISAFVVVPILFALKNKQ